MRKAVVGDTQNINLDFPEAKPGEVYKVQVIIERPDGVILNNQIDYKFYKPIKNLKPNPQKRAK